MTSPNKESVNILQSPKQKESNQQQQSKELQQSNTVLEQMSDMSNKQPEPIETTFTNTENERMDPPKMPEFESSLTIPVTNQTISDPIIIANAEKLHLGIVDQQQKDQQQKDPKLDIIKIEKPEPDNPQKEDNLTVNVQNSNQNENQYEEKQFVGEPQQQEKGLNNKPKDDMMIENDEKDQHKSIDEEPNITDKVPKFR